MLKALAVARFRHYVMANFFAINGMWIQRVVMGWLAWELTYSALFTGLIGALLFAPTILFSPLFGVVADRADIRRMFLRVQACQVAMSLLMIGVVISGLLSQWSLVLIAVLIGVIQSAHHPCRLALAPRLVPRALLPKAVATVSLNFNVARMIGPAAGGLVISEFGITTALSVTMASYVPVLMVVFLMSLDTTPNSTTTKAGMTEAVIEGGRYVMSRPLILYAMMFSMVISLCGRSLFEILPVIADGIYEKGASGLGQLTSAAGFGAVASSVFLGIIKDSARTLPSSISMTSLLAGGCIALVGLDINWYLMLALIAVVSALATLTAIGGQTLCQMEVLDEYRARVMSLWAVIGFSGTAMGAIILGWLVELVGMETAMIAAGSAAMLLSVIIRRKNPAPESGT